MFLMDCSTRGPLVRLTAVHLSMTMMDNIMDDESLILAMSCCLPFSVRPSVCLSVCLSLIRIFTTTSLPLFR